MLSQPSFRLTEGNRYVLGPAVEVGLPWNLAVEGNALYSREGSIGFENIVSLPAKANAWEFPILGKYYFMREGANLRPFASSGYAFRKLWYDIDGNSTLTRAIETGINRFGSDFSGGPVVGGGVALKTGRFTITPEFRYTRWNLRNLPFLDANQVQILAGITF